MDSNIKANAQKGAAWLSFLGLGLGGAFGFSAGVVSAGMAPQFTAAALIGNGLLVMALGAIEYGLAGLVLGGALGALYGVMTQNKAKLDDEYDHAQSQEQMAAAFGKMVNKTTARPKSAKKTRVG